MRGKPKAVGKRATFVANFRRLEHHDRGTTVRLANVRHLTGELRAARGYLTYTEAFGLLGAGAGDVIQFDAAPEVAQRGRGALRFGEPTGFRKLPFDLWRGLDADPQPDDGRPGRVVRPKPKRLTARERQVLDLLAGGSTSDQVARTLTLSAQTVRNVSSAIYRKLGVSSRAEAVRRAREEGLVTPT